MDARAAIGELICRTGLKLDEKDFVGYLALCTPDFHYSVTTWSPEIRRSMTWLAHDLAGLKSLFDTLPRHHSDASPLTRHITVCTMERGADDGQVAVVSALQVFRTTQDGGETALFAVGKLHDTVCIDGATPLLQRREIRLATRALGYGHHIPF